MACDEHLTRRVRGQVEAEKKMFGGLAFMVKGRIACCVSGQGGLLVKVGGVTLAEMIQLDHVEPMEMGASVSDSWVYVGEDALVDEYSLSLWVDRGLTENPPKPRT